jgi:mannose-6-phosphate isomerase-like protein (cupin superfamily)
MKVDTGMKVISATLLSLVMAAGVAAGQPQPAPPPQSKPAPQQTKPKPKPAPRRQAAPVTAALTITVTDGRGGPLTGVMVRATGPVEREGATENGTVRFEGLRAGNYRLRFSHDDFITLERDIIIASGQRALDQHVMLSDAEKEPPPPPPPPEEPKPAPLPPPGRAVTVSVPDFVEQNLIGSSEPQKVSPLACSGLLQATLWQVRETWDKRQHDEADAMLYVVGGEGTLRMNDRDIPLSAGRFVSVPRGTTYGLSRRGRNPLIVLANLGGEACTP